MIEVEFRRFNHEPHGDPASRDIPAECPAGQWMTKTNMDLSALLAKHDQGDLLRSIAEAVLQRMMEADVDGLIGAGRHERAGGRTTWRNHCPAGASKAICRVSVMIKRVLAPIFDHLWALLRKSVDGRFSPFPRRIYPMAFVTGMPRVV